MMGVQTASAQRHQTWTKSRTFELALERPHGTSPHGSWNFQLSVAQGTGGVTRLASGRCPYPFARLKTSLSSLESSGRKPYPSSSKSLRSSTPSMRLRMT